MTIALCIPTDGRDDCLGRTVAAIEAQVDGDITEWYLFDDTGDLSHRDKLADWYPHFTVLTAGKRLGFGGAIANAWSYLTAHSRAQWVAWFEDDMVPARRVPLDDMVALSVAQPHLAQVALRRQPWNAEERAAGGYVEANPDSYVERVDGGHRWLETTRNWTTNPSVYRIDLCALGWPSGAHSEGRYGFALRDYGLPWGIPGEEVRFGLYGGLVDGREWIHHIGDVRVGGGY